MKYNEINAEGRIILKYLCEQHDKVVTIKEIFNVVNGCEFDSNKDDMHSLSSAISKLRKKITKNGNISYIENPRKGEFRLMLSESPFENTTTESHNEFISTNKFFNEFLNDAHKVKSIDFAFHAGSEWLNEKIKILDRVREKNISCRVLINANSDAIELIMSNMRHQDRNYTLIAENIQKWYAYGLKYSELFSIKVTHLPLLHRYYHLRTEQKTNGIMLLRYYTYNNSDSSQNYTQIFDSNSPYYQLYSKEFEYLWSDEHSIDIAKYLGDK